MQILTVNVVTELVLITPYPKSKNFNNPSIIQSLPGRIKTVLTTLAKALSKVAYNKTM
ncbi:MAG: hypothetical protein IIC75_00825 [Bacteroidetes bacterium]|nr:hypothetical protein [Bacteroidota bacterium]